MDGLLASYNSRKPAIRQRLGEFRAVWRSPAGKLFEELCFCLFTPMTSARRCDAAVRLLKENSLLFEGDAKDIARVLRGHVRFHRTKSKYVIQNRKLFFENGNSLKSNLKGFG
ncbi:MAG: hypothetical protein HY518_03900, partial [Candidatus Aenigmarchaeota archaeon]|nr:hypothetical protein [Candidatus Aenigmarchaeota archaeon]